MYGNFKYEKIVWIFILSFYFWFVYLSFVFLNNFFVFMNLLYRAEVITCWFRNPFLPLGVGGVVTILYFHLTI